MKDILAKTGYTMYDVMNGIRATASPNYQTRVPEVNDANFREFAVAMQDTVLFNEWYGQLINRIGMTLIKSKAWTNPLQILRKGEMPIGETLQEIFVDLVKAQNWKSYTDTNDAGKIYKSEPADVYATYNHINREDFYPVSYNIVDIKRAFTNMTTLENFIFKMLETLYTSEQLDEYLYMKELIKIYDEKGLFHYVHVDTTLPRREFEEELIIKVRDMSNKFTFINDNFTGLAVPQHAPKDEQVILISSELDARIDVLVLASAFNMDKAEFLARRIVVDDLGVEGALLTLVSKDWYMIYDTWRSMEDLKNPATLEMKFYYHIHQIMAVSLFENAVLFTSKEIEEPATVELTGVISDKVEVDKGQFHTFIPVVKNKGGTTANTPQAVKYLLEDKTVAGTRMEGNRLYVDIRQTENFSIKVQSLHHQDIFTVVEVEIKTDASYGE